ncbi:hypothetical protein [Candidatus Palauibacter sp.]|uniref:hypothetical protein n=1 Tax=Candidatus Palauibacter sp. TaxID=3101350 RepID=UPI003AF27351
MGAARFYEEREEEIRGIDGAEVVLVASRTHGGVAKREKKSAGLMAPRSFSWLRAAYPNYLFDTDLFIEELDLATRRQVHLPGHPLHRR